MWISSAFRMLALLVLLFFTFSFFLTIFLAAENSRGWRCEWDSGGLCSASSSLNPAVSLIEKDSAPLNCFCKSSRSSWSLVQREESLTPNWGKQGALAFKSVRLQIRGWEAAKHPMRDGSPWEKGHSGVVVHSSVLTQLFPHLQPPKSSAWPTWWWFLFWGCCLKGWLLCLAESLGSWVSA